MIHDWSKLRLFIDSNSEIQENGPLANLSSNADVIAMEPNSAFAVGGIDMGSMQMAGLTASKLNRSISFG